MIRENHPMSGRRREEERGRRPWMEDQGISNINLMGNMNKKFPVLL